MAKFLRQCLGCQHIDGHTQQAFQLDLNSGNIHQGGLRCRVDNDVKIALLGVQAMKNGAENPCIAGAMRRNYPPNGGTV